MQPQRQRDHAPELHRKHTEPVLTRALVEPLLQHCGRHVEKARRPWLQCAFASEQQASISLRPGTQSSGPHCATGDGVATEAHAGSSRPFFSRSHTTSARLRCFAKERAQMGGHHHCLRTCSRHWKVVVTSSRGFELARESTCCTIDARKMEHQLTRPETARLLGRDVLACAASY